MKRCPECRRDYYDDTLLYCLDDGNALLEGPALGRRETEDGGAENEPATAILSEPPALAGGPLGDDPTRRFVHTTDQTAILSEPGAVATGFLGGEDKTRAQIDTTDQTAILSTGAKAEPRESLGELSEKRSFSSNRASKPLMIFGIAVVLLVGGFFAYRYLGSNAKQIDSIAVMPFQNSNDSIDSEYLTDGLAESLIYSLSQIEGLRVSPTSSVFRYKGKQTDSVAAGKELGVETVMTGRIAQRGDDLTISVELVDVRNSKTLWGEKYDRKMSDLLATQREIAAEIVQKLKLKLAGESKKELKKTYTADNEAYQLYLKGRFHYLKRTKADLEKGVEYYEQAIARDPGFALAYVGISEAYRTMPSYGYVASREVAARARAAAQKALEIDPGLAEAHAAVAGVAVNFDWDWQKAESEYKNAIELGPNVAEIHKNYGYGFLVPMGRFREAIVELKRALELEPLSVIYVSHLASSYMYDGQLDKALEQTAEANYLAAGHPTVSYHSCVVYNKAGMYDKAIELAEEGLEKDPANQDSLVNAGYAYAKSGKRRKAEEIIERLREISKTQYVLTSYFAQIYGALGEKDMAITELEKAFEARDVDVTKINVHPYFDDLRDDPRFAAIAKRVGLPNRK
ncbi:MAG: tetratricopeptide repeat protein [Pyrinomonadaceae bacterium]